MAEEKIPNEQEPVAAAAPAADEHVGTLHIDLGQLFGLRRVKRFNNLEHLARTAAMATVLGEISKREHVELILRGCWKTCERLFHYAPRDSGDYIDIQLLKEYFAHAGDWSAMAHCLRKTGESLQTQSGEYDALYAETLAMARAEYVKDWAGK